MTRDMNSCHYLTHTHSIVENIAIIPLAKAEPKVGTQVNACGWGKTSDNPFAGVSNTLNKVKINVADDQEAIDYYGDLDYSTKICIDASTKHGTCNVSSRLSF